jgi:hypothetical protein
LPILALKPDDSQAAGPLPPTGIIAARYDYLIPFKNTQLAAAMDHVVVAALHKTLPFSRKVSTLATRFLESGRFWADYRP